MSELSVRRDMELSAARYQKAARTGKQTETAKTEQTQSVRSRSAMSESLQKLVSKLNQMTTGLSRADRRLVQAGESSLTEVKGSLERMGKLVDQAAGEDPGALKSELEKLSQEVDRLLQSASYNGVKLFGTEGEEAYTELATDMMTLMRDLVDRAAAGEMPEQAEMQTLMDGVRQLMDKMAEGVTPDEALLELSGGGPAGSLLDLLGQMEDQALLDFLQSVDLCGELPLLLGMAGEGLSSGKGGLEGYDLDLLVGLAAARQAAGPTVPAGSAGVGTEEPLPAETRQFGVFQVSGDDLSGVSYDPKTGTLTLSGDASVTVEGQGQDGQSGQKVVLTGSGTAMLKNVKDASVEVRSPEGKLETAGVNTLTKLELRPCASVRLGGGGHLKLGILHGDHTNTVSVTGGAVTVDGGKGDLDRLGAVVVEGGASLAAHASHVRGEGGQSKAPLDLMLRTFLPGWDGVTELEVDGRSTRTVLSSHGDQVRLWLEKGSDPSGHGYPIHTVAFKRQEEDGQVSTHYAYIQWNERAGRFVQVTRYPNPFTVTGGEEGADWTYDEPSHTLTLLTDKVSAVSGGDGVDAEEAAFHGRLAIEPNIGALSLILDGVSCRAEAGRGLDLGAGNEIALLLEHDTENFFESGPGCAGISLGDGTTLMIDVTVTEDPAEDGGEDPEPDRPDCEAAPAPETEAGESGEDGGEEEPPPPSAKLTALGGEGAAGIGRDSGGSWDRVSSITIRGGEITAVGSGGGAGIGAGRYGFMGDIEIAGGTVSATGGKLGGAGIGGALGAQAGNITITGGEVSAEASYHAAAIGAGVEGECGDIRIGASARIVKAKGGDPGADIGACTFGRCGQVTIEGGADTGKAVSREEPAGEIPLGIGEDALSLPRLQLSSKTLLLNTLNVVDWDSAWAAKGVINAAMRRVARLRETYGDLHDLGDEYGRSPRTVEEAAVLLDSLRTGAGDGAAPHGGAGSDEVNKLLKQQGP